MLLTGIFGLTFNGFAQVASFDDSSGIDESKVTSDPSDTSYDKKRGESHDKQDDKQTTHKRSANEKVRPISSWRGSSRQSLIPTHSFLSKTLRCSKCETNEDF